MEKRKEKLTRIGKLEVRLDAVERSEAFIEGFLIKLLGIGRYLDIRDEVYSDYVKLEAEMAKRKNKSIPFI